MRRVGFIIALLAAMAAGSHIADAAQQKSSKAKAEAAPAAPLNLNTATVAQLDALPGVGTATAKLIVEHRQKNGGFKKIEDLMNVRGIGEKSFLNLKPLITVTAPKSAAP